MAWQYDASHSQIGFSVRHMMVAKVRGHFTDAEVDLHIDEARPGDSRVEARVKVASITTGDERRDEHLRSADFFDAANHPELVFRSTRVEPLKGDQFRVLGDLTIRGVTHPVTLQGEYLGPAQDPYGNTRLGFSLQGEIDREAFGLTWNQALEAGGVMVGKNVQLAIEAEVFEPSQVASA